MPALSGAKTASVALCTAAEPAKWSAAGGIDDTGVEFPAASACSGPPG